MVGLPAVVDGGADCMWLSFGLVLVTAAAAAAAGSSWDACSICRSRRRMRGAWRGSENDSRQRMEREKKKKGYQAKRKEES